MCLPRGVLEVGRPSASTKEGTRRFRECREIQAQQRGGWRVTSPGRVMGLFLVGCIIKLGKWHIFLEIEAHPSWCLQALPELVEASVARGFPAGSPLSRWVCKASGDLLRALPHSYLLEGGIHHFPGVSSLTFVHLDSPPRIVCNSSRRCSAPTPSPQRRPQTPDPSIVPATLRQRLPRSQALVVKGAVHGSPDSALTHPFSVFWFVFFFLRPYDKKF